MFQDFIEILILSAIQGISEFLPISSSAHLIIVSNLYELKSSSLLIDISLHLGSLLAIIFFFILNRHRKYLSGRSLLATVLSMVLLLPVLAILYNANYAIAERFDILIERFTQMFDLFLKYGGQDASVTERQYRWSSYLSTIDQWIIRFFCAFIILFEK